MDGGTNATPNGKVTYGTLTLNTTYMSTGYIAYYRRGNVVIITCENVKPLTAGNDKLICPLPFTPIDNQRAFGSLHSPSGVTIGLILVDWRNAELYGNFSDASGGLYGSITYFTDA